MKKTAVINNQFLFFRMAYLLLLDGISQPFILH